MRNDFSIVKEVEKDGVRHITTDPRKAVFYNLKWEELGDFGKRKCENLLFLTKMNESRVRIKIHYA